MVRNETARLCEALGGVLITVHHIGSTSIPGILAKPIIDLMPLVTTLTDLDERRSCLEALSYGWYGEFGIAGRRIRQLDRRDRRREESTNGDVEAGHGLLSPRSAFDRGSGRCQAALAG